jgi:hypothetical protein
MDEASGSDTHGGAQRTERSDGLALVEQWRASGQSVARFCRERAVPVHRLHDWKRQAEPVARREDAPSATEFLADGKPSNSVETRKSIEHALAAPRRSWRSQATISELGQRTCSSACSRIMRRGLGGEFETPGAIPPGHLFLTVCSSSTGRGIWKW